jgi:hypothetical protein
MLKDVIEYVTAHADRGPCRCGRCSGPPDPEDKQPAGHTVNLVFFEVSAKDNPDAETFRQLVIENKEGAYTDVDLFDGREHNYIELGGWIGDQGLAMMLMGLGTNLGLWKLLSPYTILGEDTPVALAMQAAGQGLLAIQAEQKEATT